MSIPSQASYALQIAPRESAVGPHSSGEDRAACLASYMTHELRAPLTAIYAALSMMEIQLAGGGDDGMRRMMTLALRNAERLNGLVTDILDFEKLSVGRMRMDFAPTAPEKLLAESADSLRASALAKGVSLHCGPREESLPRVLADGRRCVQVLTNLLSNAIKFTPPGGRVELSARAGGPGHPQAVLFEVADTGPGIPAEDLERVFGCFEQSALGEKTSSGTGLGLTLARLMVEGQGGRIWAEGRRRRGAAFLFTLPVALLA
jgi:signal transduction histidine kinase